jgi:hypothetical protein
MSKHTPWRVENKCVYDYDNNLIAVCSLAPNEERAEANALLIVAAPDMLVQLLNIYHAITTGESSMILSQLEHVIEAATGQTIDEITAATGREG